MFTGPLDMDFEKQELNFFFLVGLLVDGGSEDIMQNQ